MLDAGSKQALHKIRWKPINNGGFIREYIPEDSGNNLLRLATIEEVVPNEKYYVVDPIKPNVFYETSFGSEVSWDTIMEFIDTKRIYIKNDKKIDAPEQSTNKAEREQSSLF